jgi:HSP20 family protein
VEVERMATRDEWDPLRELLGVQKRMNDLFERALARTNFETSEGFDSWTPVCDVCETREALILYLELPGLEQQGIDLRLDGDELVVAGERRMDREHSAEQYHRVERSYGRFSRRFHLPSTVDRTAVQASYHGGLLRVVLPIRGVMPNEPIRVSIG